MDVSGPHILSVQCAISCSHNAQVFSCTHLPQAVAEAKSLGITAALNSIGGGSPCNREGFKLLSQYPK